MLRGTRIAQAYIAATVDGSKINEDIVDAFDEAGPGVSKAGEEHGEKYGDNFSEGFLSKMRGKISQRLSSSFDGNKIGGDAGDDAGQTFVDRMSEKVGNLSDRIGAELSDRMASNPEQVRRGIDRAFDDEFADRVGDRLGARIADRIGESMERNSATLSDAVDRMLAKAVSGNGSGGGGVAERSMSDRIGRMLGAGSRNNALNLFGRIVGGLSSIIFKVGSAFTGVFSTFSKGFSQAAEGASLLTRTMSGFGAVGTKAASGIGSAFASIAVAAPVAIAAIVAMVAAMTILVTIASALLAIVTALVAVIAQGLVAAVAVGAGAFLALGAAVGLAVMAFKSMTEEQREALAVFEPLHEIAAGLGQIMLTKMIPAFDGWSRSLQVALSLLKPLADVMGGAFVRAGNIMTAALSGPGIRLFIDELALRLPRIVANLSRAFGGFLNGTAGVFAVLVPAVQRFSGWLARVAEDFAKWATSAKGQNSIRDFVVQALGALRSLWDFIGAVGGLISEVFFSKAGKRSGSNIFDSMTSGVKRFTAYLAKNNRLENWLKDGEKFAVALGDAIEFIGQVLEDLNNSAVIEGIAWIAKIAENAYGWWDKLPDAIADSATQLTNLLGPVGVLINAFRDLTGLMNTASNWEAPQDAANMLSGESALGSLLTSPLDVGKKPPRTPTPGNTSQSTIDSLIASGNAALGSTLESHGGHLPDPKDREKKKKEWKNPYIDYANSILADTPAMIEQIRTAVKEARTALREAIVMSMKDLTSVIPEVSGNLMDGLAMAVESTDYEAIQDSFKGIFEQIAATGVAAMDEATASAQAAIDDAVSRRNDLVANAEAAVQSAASDLAGATNKKDAKRALATLNQAQKDLAIAETKGDALVARAVAAGSKLIGKSMASARKIFAANSILAAQSVFTYENALNLTRGIAVETATLADYAEARRWAAESLEMANQRLAEAIDIRNNYATAVADSVRAFGSLLTAQAKTIDGVEQVLTAGDITTNLRDRLDKIKTFQENLRQLLALGLSNDAYKQLVDAGVEGGSAYAAALVAGGTGAISEVNSLTSQISSAGESLGIAAANQMYQAGVDAAQGLVDGLTSLSAELDAAAAALGASIAAAIKRTLGIASPSRVLRDMMGNVGDGTVLGLDDQHVKVSTAAARLSDQIAVSPEVAAYAGRQGETGTVDGAGEGVSGNRLGPKVLWTGDMITPTKDPHAVAVEALNELAARL